MKVTKCSHRVFILRPGLRPRCVCVCTQCYYSRSVAVDLQGVDAVLGEAAALQEGAVVAQLHALAREVAGLEQLDAVVLAVLRERERTPETR